MQMQKYQIERSELVVRVDFGSPFWPLVHNIPKLYSALLTTMRDFGVTSHSIRSDSGDGTIGAYNVNFWILDFMAVARIRLESLEFQVPNFANSDVDTLDRAFVAVMRAITEAEALGSLNYAVTVSTHGRLVSVNVRDFVSTFVRNAPDIGPILGSGVLFYYGNRPPVTLSTIALDLSGVIADGLMMRLSWQIDGSALSPQSLREVITEQSRVCLAGLGLSTESS